MPLSMYEASVPVFVRTLSRLKAILEKGAAHAQAKKIDDMVLLSARLFPDMFPLASQVHIATDQARGGAARLAGGEPPSYGDDEKTFAELIARVDRTIEFLKTLKPEQFEGAETRQITRPYRGQPKVFVGINYLRQLVVPNVYFHTVTTYDILRHNGVELGKADYLGDLD
jgi:uncharacterized protein